MKAKTLLLLALLAPLFTLTALADDPVEVGGIYYTLVPKGKIATVTKKEIQKQDEWGNTYTEYYSGPINIPSTITPSGSSTSYTVVGIEAAAFYGSSITSVTIPNSITSIPECCFMGCSNLTSITIPESVTSIDVWAFMDCDNLDAVYINSLASWCQIDYLEPTHDYGCATNPLEYAHKLYLNGKQIKDLVIPNGVTKVSYLAFSGCSSLTSVAIPESVTSIGNEAFKGCSGLTSFIIPNSVTAIGSSAFSNCSGLASVSIPNSVTSIGHSAFKGCGNLTSIILPNSVTNVSSGAFKDCSSLTSVTIPNSVTTIGGGAFSGCSSLTSVTIPESVTGIGKSAFEGCINLTSIDMPESVFHIADRAFYGCSNLTSVNIPELVEFIYSQTFYGCSSLTSIIIPYVRNIEEQAFYGCTSLRSVILENVDFRMYGWMEFIWGEAFANCISLEEFTIGSLQFDYDSGSGDCAVPAVSSVFENSFVEYATLHVPESAIGLYKAHSTWGQFGTITSLGSASQYYKLFVDVNSKGKVVYGEGEFAKTITGASQTFDVKEQEDIVLTLTPNEGYKLGTVTVNGVNKTAAVVDGVLTITDVNANQNVSVEFVLDGTSVAVTIGELGVATFCSEEALDFSGTEDVKAYIVSAFRPSTGNVTLTRITDVPAGTGIVLLGNAGTYDIPLGAGETIVSNLLVGVTSSKTLNKVEGANTNFILADGENGIGFYTVVDGSTLAAGKAYLPLPTAALPSNAQSIGLRFDGTTGIRSMENGQWTMDNEEWFTIDGRRLDAEPTAKGLYIVNGRKVIVK